MPEKNVLTWIFFLSLEMVGWGNDTAWCHFYCIFLGHDKINHTHYVVAFLRKNIIFILCLQNCLSTFYLSTFLPFQAVPGVIIHNICPLQLPSSPFPTSKHPSSPSYQHCPYPLWSLQARWLSLKHLYLNLT